MIYKVISKNKGQQQKKQTKKKIKFTASLRSMGNGCIRLLSKISQVC